MDQKLTMLLSLNVLKLTRVAPALHTEKVCSEKKNCECNFIFYSIYS